MFKNGLCVLDTDYKALTIRMNTALKQGSIVIKDSKFNLQGKENQKKVSTIVNLFIRSETQYRQNQIDKQIIKDYIQEFTKQCINNEKCTIKTELDVLASMPSLSYSLSETFSYYASS